MVHYDGVPSHFRGLLGYKGGLGIWGVYNLICLRTILYSMVGGFVYVNYIVYLWYCDND